MTVEASGTAFALGVAGVLACALLSPVGARAQNCFEDLSNTLSPGTAVTLHLTDGTEVRGRLAFLDTRERSILLGPLDGKRAGPAAYRMASIASLDYRSNSTEWLFVGTLGGMALGGAAFHLMFETRCGDSGLNPHACGLTGASAYGMLLGGLASAAAGAILSRTFKDPHSVPCAGEGR